MGLHLSRKQWEKIVIGDDIVITVLGFPKDGVVQLNIEAPREITVHREEIRDRIRREQMGSGE
jgi:carbon storage regulator